MNLKGPSRTLPRYAVTVALALAVLALALPLEAVASSGAMLGLAFILPIAVLWILYSAARMLFRPAERKERAIRLAIWIPATVLAVISMQYRDTTARDTAASVIASVSDYKKRTGSYPKGLVEVGLNADELRSRFSMAYRLQSDGKVFLLYSQPSMPLVSHSYDFQAGAWQRFD